MTAKYAKGRPLPLKPPFPAFLLHPSTGKTSKILGFGTFNPYPVPTPPDNNHWISVPQDPNFWASLLFGHTEDFSQWDADNSWYYLKGDREIESRRMLIPKNARKKLIRMIVNENFFMSLERSGTPYRPTSFHPMMIQGVEQRLWLFTSNSHSQLRTLTEAVHAVVETQVSQSVIALPENDFLDVQSQLHGAAPGNHYSALTEYDADALPWVNSSDIHKWELYSANMDGRRAGCFLSVKKGLTV